MRYCLNVQKMKSNCSVQFQIRNLDTRKLNKGKYNNCFSDVLAVFSEWHKNGDDKGMKLLTTCNLNKSE